MAGRVIRMNTTAAGPEGTYLAGQVVVVDVATAAAWISGGYALPVGEDAGGPSAPARPARKGARARAAETPASEE